MVLFSYIALQSQQLGCQAALADGTFWAYCMYSIIMVMFCGRSLWVIQSIKQLFDGNRLKNDSAL